MIRIKVLNLFAGIGGNVLKLDRYRYDIVSVELEQNIIDTYLINNKKDVVIKGDAMDYLKTHYKRFDIIWASPPCQTHSRMVRSGIHPPVFFDPALWQIIIFLQNFHKGPWCVENVKPYYKPFIDPSWVDGRHYFWSNTLVKSLKIKGPGDFINTGNSAGVQKMKDWLGIEYPGNVYYKKSHNPGQVLRNCVHPDLGKHIIENLK